MKYRILSQEELELLEDDLKAFLIVNGAHGDEWAEMNKYERIPVFLEDFAKDESTFATKGIAKLCEIQGFRSL
jgi:hypothetical protein